MSVCICTYNRKDLLKRLLKELDDQQTEGLFTYSVVVSDNDSSESARQVVAEFAAHSLIQTVYCVEPRQNIALARNKALSNANGDYIAFLDDDEYPLKNWLFHLYTQCNKNGVDGVLGPVKPYFEQEPPKWVTRGRFFERPTHETGYKIDLSEARTGNVLFKRDILNGVEEIFRSEFGTGGEDVDFFRRMMDKGHVFIWCNEAVVYEAVPPSRCTRAYLLRRALLRGSNSYRVQKRCLLSLLKSMIAAPVYGLALPFLLITGEHRFMRYLIKFCDHAGKLLAFLGINTVTERGL